MFDAFMDMSRGMSGLITDYDGSGMEMPNGQYYADELQFQDPKKAAFAAMLMQLGTPSHRRDPMAVMRAAMVAKSHNTRIRRVMEPRYQVANGRLLKFGPDGMFQGVEADFSTGGQRRILQGPDGHSYYENGERVLPNVQAPGKLPPAATADQNYQYIDALPDGPRKQALLQAHFPAGRPDQSKVPEYANTLRDDLRTATAGYEGALETFPMAMRLANTYANPEATTEDRTAADRGLVNLSVKLWDPTSAVLSGEYASVEAAQAKFDKLIKSVDLTSGESLSNETRKSLLRMIYDAQQGKVQQLRSRYEDFIGPATRLVGAENLDMVIPARVLQDGQVRRDLYDLSEFAPGMRWFGVDWQPDNSLTDDEAATVQRILGGQ